jgi:hypothetical protein
MGILTLGFLKNPSVRPRLLIADCVPLERASFKPLIISLLVSADDVDWLDSPVNNLKTSLQAAWVSATAVQ